MKIKKSNIINNALRNVLKRVIELFPKQFKRIKPWKQENIHGEMPGGGCCKRATGQFCFEHNPDNYKKEKE
ncbi:MAG: hypothetical protein ACTSO3_01040 [Candidatus Heimdallarchaeaceae archaeon]